jgi:hypothetical protein
VRGGSPDGQDSKSDVPPPMPVIAPGEIFVAVWRGAVISLSLADTGHFRPQRDLGDPCPRPLTVTARSSKRTSPLRTSSASPPKCVAAHCSRSLTGAPQEVAQGPTKAKDGGTWFGSGF